MEEASNALNNLQEQLLFELLKTIDKIKESSELQGSNYNSIMQINGKSDLDSLIDRVNAIADRLDVVESEIAFILETLNNLRRSVDMIYYGLKVLHKDCAMSYGF
ncbi:MAG: hypothetical protein F7B59_03825 [Desulfurococcales archaeon]|nr:hypothetical protein [Desulfurococcales archaeon]